MSPPLRAWASDHHEVSLPEAHPFPMAKYRAVREALVADGTLEPAAITRSEPAPLEWLNATHDPHHVARLLNGDLEPAALRRLGLPWSEALVRRARAAVTGTVGAAEAALADGVAVNLAGGTHHAFRDRAEGYCLFNDAAVAIHRLRASGRVRRAFVLDLDVHQGNGTAAMFAGDADTFTLSVHNRANYPLHKERSTLDVELEDGMTDAPFLDVLDRHVPAALARHDPDLVFYQAGVDGLASDRLGRWALTHDGLAARDARVFAWVRARGVPLVVMMGGGYARPLDDTVRAHANVVRAARRALDGAAWAAGSA